MSDNSICTTWRIIFYLRNAAIFPAKVVIMTRGYLFSLIVAFYLKHVIKVFLSVSSEE